MAVEELPSGRTQVKVVHAAVAGRLRIKVEGLRHDAARKLDLERRLAGCDGVLRVEASDLTGNVLVLFAPETPAGAMLARLSAALDGRPRPTQKAVAVPWHRLPPEAVVESLGSDARRGLMPEEAAGRLRRTGPNRLPHPQPRAGLAIFAAQFASLPVALLGASAVLAVLTGGVADALFIAGVVALNAAIGYVTESQAERTISSLLRNGGTAAAVVRDGARCEINPERLVPGDLLDLAPGRFVAADARLLEARFLAVDESALSGESLPALKRADALPAVDVPLAERDNMVFAGTRVSAGSGRAVVAATGPATEIGRVHALVGEARAPPTPLQRQLGQLSGRLVGLSLAISALLFVLGWLRGTPTLTMLRSAIALAVAALPEGLPTIATTTLAIGLRSLRRQGVLIRRLAAVETLGAVDVVLFDKTGTLTRNRMSLAAIAAGPTSRGFDGREAPDVDHWPAGGRLLEIAALCNDAALNGQYSHGSSTELALLQAAEGAGIDLEDLRRRHPRLGDRPRTDRRQSMATIHSDGETRLVAVKGNPQEVLAMCHEVRFGETTRPLDEEECRRIADANQAMAADGLRVLGVAEGRGPAAGLGTDRPLSELTWLGLVGLSDPLRPDMADVIAALRQSGLATVMVTGDQATTAATVARRLGFAGGDAIRVVDARQLAESTPESFGRADAFARITPADKLAVVRAHQEGGRVVAMVGDGINDGPALKAADVGLTLAAEGTDLAKEVADAVLANDDPRGLVLAIRHGRGLRHSVKTSLRFLLATNLSETLLMLVATGLGLGQPLNPVQLLWINLVSDVLPGLALATEPAGEEVLRRPAESVDAPLLSSTDFGRLAEEAAMMGGGALAAYAWGLRGGDARRGATMASHSLVLAQMMHAFSARSERHGLFRPSARPRNRPLDAAVAATLALQVLVGLVPGARQLLGLSALDLPAAGIAAAGGLLPYLLIEARKGARAEGSGAGVSGAPVAPASLPVSAAKRRKP